MEGAPVSRTASYRHTQVAYQMLAVHMMLAAGVGLRSGSPRLALVLALFFAAIWVVFGRLTVTVTDVEVGCVFGSVGRPQTSFALSDIERAQQVRTSPLAGWGMRYTLHGRLWNVWGLDAVELRLRDGRTFRIGTDQPGALLAALRRSGVPT